MDYDEEDFVFVGTPIEREEDALSRKKKSVAEASGQLRSLPSWKQEVRDEEGRRRFHGAFTGGFSAGYYNTAGSKEGWAPRSFTSSRKNRAEFKQQNIFNFLDEDEKVELQDQSFGTSSQFDTFGFTAVELARKQADKEQHKRPSAIPGPVPEEILPVQESVGVKLLTKMGWHHGRSIKDSHSDLRCEARREARKAFLAFSSEDVNTESGKSGLDVVNRESLVEEFASDDFRSSTSIPVYVFNPKEDVYGLGYDPYRNAPEFREKKKSRLSGKRDQNNRNSIGMKDSLFGLMPGRVAPGFGIGALEELDLEDEDIYSSGYEIADTYTEEIDEPLKPTRESKQKLITYEKDGLPGFKIASKSDYTSERYNAPVIPKDFVPHHKFPGPLDIDLKFAEPQPPEVPPPDDSNLKILIEGVATLVARCGKLFEDLSREKNQSNPLFSFLSGGDGHGYYLRKLWEERQKRSDQSKKPLDGKISPSMRQMTAESRARILGEKPLERSSKGSSHSVSTDDLSRVHPNLPDTLPEQVSLSELSEAKPFRDDPAKQERFEQFLKEKYQGGLRSTGSSGANNLSEAARARERLDFEAAIEAIQKGKTSKGSDFSAQQFVEFSLAGKMQFTSGGMEQETDNQAEDLIMKKMYPKREEFQWRPSPLLCKRFDLIDPYMGKPPPVPRLRSKMDSKMDSLVFMSESVKTKKVDDIAVQKAAIVSPSHAQEMTKDVSSSEAEVKEAVENVERPVDLYKAIFSDDSDNDEDEEETSNLNKVEDSEKKNEAANTALSRLIAGDFLESLGKELGLEVPPDTPHLTNNAMVGAPQKANTNADAGIFKSQPVDNIRVVHSAPNGSLAEQDRQNKAETDQDGGLAKTEVHDKKEKVRRKYTDNSLCESGSGKDNDKRVKEVKKAKASSSRRRHWSSDSSDDEISRKRSRRHRYSSSDSYSSSSSDQARHYSSSKSKKGSSKEKQRSSRHSKHKHRRRDSPSKSSHHSQKTYREAKKERTKRRD